VLQTTPRGYRASDARFLIGAIEWRRHDPMAAMASWRAMTLEASDTHAIEISEILTTLDADRSPARIDQILGNVVGRWRSLSQTRLRQFGYRFDSY
jgi:hypothetical protein